jgi:hypothetical protein
MYRAGFQPFDFPFAFPGASRQAGMERAFGAEK